MLGNSIFPPTANTLAGATQPPLARFAGGFLTSVLPTNGVSRVQSPFTTETIQSADATGIGTNTFSASYGPEIYAVYVNGIIARGAVLETLPTSEATQQVINALTPLAGSRQLFSPGTGQTATVSTGAAQSSASRSTSSAATQ